MVIGRFERTGDGYTATIDGDHNLLVQQLAHEVLVLLDTPDEPSPLLAAVTDDFSRLEPADPALTYLLPAMSGDGAQAQELRALTEDYLRAEKSSRLRKVRADLERARLAETGQVSLGHDDVWEWLAALNDVRLALGGELGVETQADVAAIEQLAAQLQLSRDQRSNAALIYMIITWWQDSLLRAVREGASSN